jgi:hypothetical protein
MLTIHPPSFVESGEDCTGINYIRSQPSRESQGLILEDINKYVASFDLPLQNVLRYVKEVDNNWNRLSQEQKNLVSESIQKMNQGPSGVNKSADIATNATPPVDINSCINFLSINPTDVTTVLNTLWNPTNDDRAKYSNIADPMIKKSIRSWTDANALELLSWKHLLLLLVILVVVFIIYAVSTRGMK